MNKHKNLYIIFTPYHLLITILKINKKNDNYIILVDFEKFKGVNLENLKKNGQINNYFYIEDVKFRRNKGVYQNNKFYKDLMTIMNNIYIYNDFTYIGQYIHHKKIKYTLIEDGFNALQYKNEIQGIKNKIKYLYLLRLPQPGGFSKYCQSIEVNDIKKVFKDSRFNKLIEVPRKQLFNNITQEKKALLLDIFELTELKKVDKKSILILTQPLSFDKLMSSEEEQYNFYKKLCDEYNKLGYTIYLKPHPRDTITYDDMENINFIKKEVPIELIEYVSDIHFDVGITHSSTALDFLNCVDKKIVLYNWNEGRFYEEE